MRCRGFLLLVSLGGGRGGGGQVRFKVLAQCHESHKRRLKLGKFRASGYRLYPPKANRLNAPKISRIALRNSSEHNSKAKPNQNHQSTVNTHHITSHYT